MTRPFVVIITGPTASGKTSLAEALVAAVPGEIINADVGQFYTPLSIGTAKTTHGNAKYYHGFDLFNEPHEYNIADYSKAVQEWVDACSKRGNLPVIVGGSLFYIKSLLFPPVVPEIHEVENLDIDFENSSENLWDLLHSIDPERANALHPNDRYRVVRALQLWQKTGQKPSTMKAQLNPSFECLIIALEPVRTELDERINQRTGQMMGMGWVEEARGVLGTEWETFVERKGMIGYSEIFDWIKNGSPVEKYQELISLIQQKTRQYAKRQLVFWKGLRREIVQSPLITLEVIRNVSDCDLEKIIHIVKLKK